MPKAESHHTPDPPRRAVIGVSRPTASSKPPIDSAMLDIQAEAAEASPDRWATARLIIRDMFSRMTADGDIPDSVFDEWTDRINRVRRMPSVRGIN